MISLNAILFSFLTVYRHYSIDWYGFKTLHILASSCLFAAPMPSLRITSCNFVFFFLVVFYRLLFAKPIQNQFCSSCLTFMYSIRLWIYNTQFNFSFLLFVSFQFSRFSSLFTLLRIVSADYLLVQKRKH